MSALLTQLNFPPCSRCGLAWEARSYSSFTGNAAAAAGGILRIRPRRRTRPRARAAITCASCSVARPSGPRTRVLDSWTCCLLRRYSRTLMALLGGMLVLLRGSALGHRCNMWGDGILCDMCVDHCRPLWSSLSVYRQEYLWDM